MDVVFRFEKEGFNSYTETRTVHEKGQLYAFFPTRIWFNQKFNITIQDDDAKPIEGVSVFMDDVKAGESDHNGIISITINSD